MTATSNLKLTVYWSVEPNRPNDGLSAYAELERADGIVKYLELNPADLAGIDMVLEVSEGLGVEVAEVNAHLRPEPRGAS